MDKEEDQNPYETEEWKRRIEDYEKWALNDLSREAAGRLLAIHIVQAEEYEEKLEWYADNFDRVINLLSEQLEKRKEDIRHLTELINAGREVTNFANASYSEIKSMKAKASRIGKNAAELRHNKDNGSRKKRDAIKEAWASGKYSSRDICAEQECAAIGMSIGTARRALQNTPDPRLDAAP